MEPSPPTEPATPPATVGPCPDQSSVINQNAHTDFRHLRLSRMLQDLGAFAGPKEDRPPAPEQPDNLTPRLRRKWRKKHEAKLRSNLSIGDMIDHTKHAGFGFLAALLALLAAAVPIGGPMGLAIALLGVQMIIGRDFPWIPGRLRQYRIAMSTLDWITHRLVKWTLGAERYIRPRLPIMTRGPFWGACGVGLIFMGLGLAQPIPGTNYFFIIPSLLYAIGMLEDDGALILTAHAITFGFALAIWLSWDKLWQQIHDHWPWLAA
jgi:hypothetical protein